MIFRAKHGRDNPYFRSRRATPQDPRLGWQERGLLYYMLSLPDDWAFNVNHLVTVGDLKRDALHRVLARLAELGYVHRYQERLPDGRLGPWRTDVYEVPQSGFPTAAPQPHFPAPVFPAPVFPEPEKPEPENAAQHKKKKYRLDTQQNTHHTEAPDGAQGVGVCRVVSVHSRQVCREYAQHLHESGQGIANPGGYATAICNGARAGQADELITQWQAGRRAADAAAARGADCAYCRDSLVRQQRFIKTTKQPRGAWKDCTHDPQIEDKFPAAD